jgi:murein DD-endopeptidase MepM/ murein hydrolase activator NlpD
MRSRLSLALLTVSPLLANAQSALTPPLLDIAYASAPLQSQLRIHAEPALGTLMWLSAYQRCWPTQSSDLGGRGSGLQPSEEPACLSSREVRDAPANAAGKHVWKPFFRAPLDITQISSGFTLGRLHPLLKVRRAHKGVDYPALLGTKVQVTADGVIDFAGRRRGYGRVMVVDHGNGYSTLYAHLSGFARYMVSGRRLKQGELIAYVGMSGLATRPHLHYELLVHGVPENPVSHTLPAGDPIKPETRDLSESRQTTLLGQSDASRQL